MSQIMDNSINGNVNDKCLINNISGKDGYDAIKKANIGVYGVGEKEASLNTDGIGYKYVPMTGEDKRTEKKFDRFAEYMRSRQEKTEEEWNAKEAERREQKEDAKEIRQYLSSEELKRLRMMGIDIQSANMSDLRGIINTMRANENREKTAAMMAEIKAGNNEDNITIVGADVMVAGTRVELSDIDVTDVMAEKAGSPDDFEIGNDELVFLIKNNLPVTKDMLYKAHFSGSKALTMGIDTSEFEMMKPQIEKVIAQAGYNVDGKSLDGSRFLLDNNLPVTTDSIRMYMKFQSIVGEKVNQVDVSLFDDADTEKEALNLFETVKDINPDIVYEMALEKREITISSIKKFSETIEKAYSQTNESVKNDNYKKIISDDEKRAITARRQMEEIRLTMTLDVAKRITSLDVNIDTRELSRVITALKNAERQFIKEQFVNNGFEPTEEDVNIYQEVNAKVGELRDAPAAIVALPIKDVEFTVNGLHSKIKSFEAVRNSYQAVETVPRKDMGDSIQKAFSNVDSLLEELDIPVNYETSRAARILGYNQLEITEDNIYRVVEYDREVNELITGFYPEAVMGIIKDGINPLDISIDELNHILRTKNYNEGVSDAENFATYLRDIDRQGKITEEERNSYIGLYRIMNQLAKKGDREAGWIFANGGRLTIRNLIAGMRSMKSAGIDVTINADFGMLSSATKEKPGIDRQIESAFTSDKQNQSEVIDELDRYISEDADVIKFIEENHIEKNMINTFAAESMIKGNGIYELILEVMSKLKYLANSKDEMIDDATGEIASSLSGEEVPIDFSVEGILNQLGDADKLSLTYEDIRDQILELMYSAGSVTTLSRRDITSIKMACAGINILSNMAKDNKYQIPIQTDDGIKVMNLVIKHDDAGAGNIQIDMGDEEAGHLHAEINVDSNNNMNGYIVSSVSEMNYKLMSKSNEVLLLAQNAGFNVEAVSLGQMQEIKSGSPDNAKQSVSNNRLYEASVQIIRGLSDLVINDNRI